MNWESNINNEISSNFNGILYEITLHFTGCLQSKQAFQNKVKFLYFYVLLEFAKLSVAFEIRRTSIKNPAGYECIFGVPLVYLEQQFMAIKNSTCKNLKM